MDELSTDKPNVDSNKPHPYQHFDTIPIEKVLKQLEGEAESWKQYLSKLKSMEKIDGQTKFELFRKIKQTSISFSEMIPYAVQSKIRQGKSTDQENVPGMGVKAPTINDTGPRSTSPIALNDETFQLEEQMKVLFKENENLQGEVKRLQNDIRTQKDIERTLTEHISKLEHTLENTKQSLQEISEQKGVLMLRLSKLAGDKLMNNNPDITDLSDPNRPLKLADKYNELYDNEWTDAFEVLVSSGYTDMESIETLQQTLLNTFEFCEMKATLVLKKTGNALNLLFEDEYQEDKRKTVPVVATMPRKRLPQEFAQYMRHNSTMEDYKLQKKWLAKRTSFADPNPEDSTAGDQEAESVHVDDQMKILRKDVSISMIPVVQRAYMKARWSKNCLNDLQPYILGCLGLCWMMVVQNPQMCFKLPDKDQRFDTNCYKQYTKTGALVDFVVWPALLLHEDGPLVGKGVAQAKKE